jgi:hypothetical protein
MLHYFWQKYAKIFNFRFQISNGGTYFLSTDLRILRIERILDKNSLWGDPSVYFPFYVFSTPFVVNLAQLKTF